MADVEALLIRARRQEESTKFLEARLNHLKDDVDKLREWKASITGQERKHVTQELEIRRLLRQEIIESFNDEELRVLSADLGLSYDNLIGESQLMKVQSLIQQVDSRNERSKLINLCRLLRPNRDWSKF